MALRLASELHPRFSCPLSEAVVDIKSAFDSVCRVALWKSLRDRGVVPDFLLKLLEDPHSHTGARVSVGDKLSERFITTSSVRQGCVLALQHSSTSQSTGFSATLCQTLASVSDYI